MLQGILESAAGGAAWGAGFAVAAGAAIVGGGRAKPLAKRAIKGYFAVTQRAREWAAETAERAQDLYAEAKYEYESELESPDPTDGSAGTTGDTTGSGEASATDGRSGGASARPRTRTRKRQTAAAEPAG